MLLLVIDSAATGCRKIMMAYSDEMYSKGGQDWPGYRPVTSLLPTPIGEDFFHEYIIQELYEGGNVCGVYTDSEADKQLFSRALLPEDDEEVSHINDVILAYGRGAKTN